MSRNTVNYMEPVDVSDVDVNNVSCLVTSFLYVIVHH